MTTYTPRHGTRIQPQRTQPQQTTGLRIATFEADPLFGFRGLCSTSAIYPILTRLPVRQATQSTDLT
jgi:hypothetical protein